MPESARGRYRLLLNLVAIAVVVLGIGYVKTYMVSHSGGSSTLTRSMHDEMLRQGIDGMYARRIRGATPEQATQITTALVQHGIARLDLPALIQRQQILLGIDSTIGEAGCAGRFRGTGDRKAFQQALERLPPEQQNQWVYISVRGMEGEMNGYPPVTPTTDHEMDYALTTIRSYLPDADKARFMDVMQHSAEKSDAEVCWVALTIGKTVLAMPNPPQEQVMKTLAKVEAGI